MRSIYVRPTVIARGADSPVAFRRQSPARVLWACRTRTFVGKFPGHPGHVIVNLRLPPSVNPELHTHSERTVRVWERFSLDVPRRSAPSAVSGFDWEPEPLRAGRHRPAAAGQDGRPGPDQGQAARSGVAAPSAICRVPGLIRIPGIPVSGQSGISAPPPAGAPREAIPVHEAGFHPPGGKVI